MSDAGFKKSFICFGIIGIIGSVTFFLAQQHVYWNKDEIMAARMRIAKAAAEGKGYSNISKLSKLHSESTKKELESEQNSKTS